MTTDGVVRFWLDEDGWGVIDSAETPGGCWAHFSAIERMSGYRALQAGDAVRLAWEAADQDGYDYRALAVVKVDDIVEPGPGTEPT